MATTSQNSLPVAVDDTAYVIQSSGVLIDVLGNDSDADTNVIGIATASVNFGTVMIEDDKLYYQAIENFYGTDTINYSITDHNGGTAYAQVYVTVDPVQAAAEINVVASGTNGSGDSGGSMGRWILFVISLIGFARYSGARALVDTEFYINKSL